MAEQRSILRLKDLKARRPATSKLMNLKLPVEILDAIDRLAKKLNATKTSVVVALLNEALAAAGKKTR